MLRSRKCLEVECFSLLESPSRLAQHLTHAADSSVQNGGKNWNHKQATLTLEALRRERVQVSDVEYDPSAVDDDEHHACQIGLADLQDCAAELQSELQRRVRMPIDKNDMFNKRQACDRRLIFWSGGVGASVLLETLLHPSGQSNELYESRIAGLVLWTDLGKESLRKEQGYAQSLSHQTKSFQSQSPAALEVDTFDQRITRNLWAFRRRRRSYRTVEIYRETEPCPSGYETLSANSGSWSLDGGDISHRQQLKPITTLNCVSDDFEDCLCWTTLGLIRAQRPCRRGPERSSQQTSCIPVNAFLRLRLETLISQVDAERRDTFLKILEWNCYSRRLLQPHELLTALSTKTDLDREPFIAIHTTGPLDLQNEAELIGLCKGILKLTEEGYLDFVDETFKPFLKTSEARGLGIRKSSTVHELIAAVCFRHIACLSQQLILRPWISIGQVLRGEIGRCAFREYAIFNWHEHFRKADPSSKYLPFLLYRIIEDVFKVNGPLLSSKTGTRSTQSRINEGLCICSMFDSRRLGSAYIDMGASLKTECLGLDMTMLHVAAANKSAYVIDLLLERGADVEGRVQQDMSLERRTSRTPLHVAAAHGHQQVAKMLVRAGADINAKTTNTRKTALQLAVEFGHWEVVDFLLDYGAETTIEVPRDSGLIQIALACGHELIAELLSQKRCATSVSVLSHKRKTEIDDSLCGTHVQLQNLSLEERRPSLTQVPTSQKEVTHNQRRRIDSFHSMTLNTTDSEDPGWYLVEPTDYDTLS